VHAKKKEERCFIGRETSALRNTGRASIDLYSSAKSTVPQFSLGRHYKDGQYQEPRIGNLLSREPKQLKQGGHLTLRRKKLKKEADIVKAEGAV